MIAARWMCCGKNAIDLVMSLNGIPVATVELKSDYTQSVEDAVDQYRFDRHPRPKGQAAAEPLLDFPRGAGAFRGEQQHRDDGYAPVGCGDHFPAVQQGRRARGGQPGEPERASHGFLGVGGTRLCNMQHIYIRCSIIMQLI